MGVMGYRRGSFAVGAAIACAGAALAVTSGVRSGVVALAIGSWIIVRSILRMVRPQLRQDNGSPLRQVGLRFSALGLAAVTVAIAGFAGAVPPFEGGRRWPFAILFLPGALFAYAGGRAAYSGRKAKRPN